MEFLTDDKAKKLLKSLFDNEVKIYFPYYANTFPLAYHYSLLFSDIPAAIGNQIIEYDWNNSFPSQEYDSRDSKILNKVNVVVPSNISVFFSSKENGFYKSLLDERNFNNEAIECVEFSIYKQRLFFIDNSNIAIDLLENPKPEIEDSFFKDNDFKLISSSIKKYIEDNNIDYCIYSDIPLEAERYFEQFPNFEKNKVVASSPSSLLNLNKESIFKIYFYGAPASMFFLDREKHKHRFIPVYINDNDKGQETFAYIHYNSKEHKDSIDSIKEDLEKYFKLLFETAFNDSKGYTLNNVRVAYNRIASIRRHPSYFYTPKAFADCIKYHNIYKISDSTDDIIRDKSNALNNGVISEKISICHFGLGKIGIGLVMPSIFNSEKEKENSEKKNFYVIQKLRPGLEWQAYKNYKNFTFNALGEEVNYSQLFSEGENPKIKFVEDYKEIEDIVKECDFITYSFGDKQAQIELYNLLNKIEYKGIVIPFENAIAEKTNDSSFQLVEAKIDRICSNRKIKSIENKVEISVDIEDHYEIILFHEKNEIREKLKNLFVPNLTNYNTNIRICKIKEEYDFFELRKKYFVNGLHFFLALIAYDLLRERKIENWNQQYVTILQSAMNEDSKYKLFIDSYIEMITIYVISTTIKDENIYKLINNYYGFPIDDKENSFLQQELFDYAKGVKERFKNSKADAITRVLKILVEESSGDVILPDSKKLEEKLKDFYINPKKRFVNDYKILNSSDLFKELV